MKYLNFKDWRVHAFCFAMVVAAELMGNYKVNLGILSFTLLPMLYALVMGVILAVTKVTTKEMMNTASPYIGISVCFLTAKMGSTIGPNLSAVLKAGPALILQEFGNLGTIFLALPVAVLVFKMGRQAVGASFSISREGSLAIIGDLYGLDSEEGQGVMGAYITGTLLGTIFNGLLASFCVGIGLFHPYSLAMAAGTGSASMMTAALGPIVEAYKSNPDMVSKIQTYAASSQVLTGLDGLYMSLFMGIPMTNWLYKKLKREKNQPAQTKAESK